MTANSTICHGQRSKILSGAARAAIFLILAFVDQLALRPAFSWFDKGHRIVGLIAQENLTSAAQKEIERILPKGSSLADATVWPDHEGRAIREYDPLHYVSVAETAAGYDQARDCPEKNCVVEALRWFLTAAADKSAPIMTRRVALRYVAHFVGDLHQPLHAGRAADHGGVDIRVGYKGTATNLHFFWDRDLVDLEPGSEEEIAKRLIAQLTPDERRAWQAGDPKQWIDESLVLVRSHAYNTGASAELTDDYVGKARPVVRTRLVQAGIRLAWLLNSAFK